MIVDKVRELEMQIYEMSQQLHKLRLSTAPVQGNAPGVVCYQRKNDAIYRLGGSSFGPGDQYCSIWPLLSLAGIGTENWTPQYNYWQRPQKMDDGGENLND